MKTVGFIGNQVRRALNESRGYISAADLTDAIQQASYTVFGRYAGHEGLLRPGQPLPSAGYGINDPVNAALNPFLRTQEYTKTPTTGQLPWASDGTILFPTSAVVAGSFQRPVALTYPGARGSRQVNENALAATVSNSLLAPTLKFTLRSPVPGGYKVLPGPDTTAAPAAVTLQFLGAPPQCKYAESPNPDDPYQFDYDDAASIDVGWKDATAINLIIAEATRLLGGQVKDGQAANLATQTEQLGA